MSVDCIFCSPSEALGVVQVWEDDHWRLLADLGAEVLGFSLLVPKRHIPYITELDGDEARTFGAVLGRTAEVLQSETNAEFVYVYIFGSGVPHPDVCIPPPPPDLDCKDIPYRNFRVIYNVPAPDPHGFDGDHDGIGCET